MIGKERFPYDPTAVARRKYHAAQRELAAASAELTSVERRGGLPVSGRDWPGWTSWDVVDDLRWRVANQGLPCRDLIRLSASLMRSREGQSLQ